MRAPVLYDAIARPFQQWGLCAHSIAQGAVCRCAGLTRFRRRVRDVETMGTEEIRDWQQRQLHDLMQYAVRHVPFYHGRPCANSPAEALRALSTWPILLKDEVVAARRKLRADRLQLRFRSFTSGSTGTPMTLYRTPQSVAIERALIERQLRWVGWRPGDRRVWLRGAHILPLDSWRGPFWRHNAAEHMLVCSSFHLRDDTIAHYVSAMEDFNPGVIQAYPSSIACIARWLLRYRRRYRVGNLKGIVTSSETISELQRQQICSAFGVPVFDWYGQAERVGAIGTCSHGSYHIMEDSGLLELLVQSNGVAEVVGTGFGNQVMPLLRYRTGDQVVLKDSSFRCACGSAFRCIDRVLGRASERIVTSDGREHVMLDFIFDGVDGVRQAQIVQERLDEVCLRVVLYPGVRLQDVAILVDRARYRLGGHVLIGLQQVESLELSPSGKLPFIVNKQAK